MHQLYTLTNPLLVQLLIYTRSTYSMLMFLVLLRYCHEIVNDLNGVARLVTITSGMSGINLC